MGVARPASICSHIKWVQTDDYKLVADISGSNARGLARALFRPVKPLSTGVEESVAAGEVAKQEIAADQSGGGVTHLDDGV